jgi:putative oxidoreductase
MMAISSLGFRTGSGPATGFAQGHHAGYDGLLLFGRVVMALIFVQSGFGKLVDVGAFSASLAGKGVPFAGVLALVGAGVEFFGGLAVLLGLQTRYAAALIALFTIVATLISHRYWEFSGPARRAQEVSFSKNTCIVGGYLLLMATGGGRFSLDRLWQRRA